MLKIGPRGQSAKPLLLALPACPGPAWEGAFPPESKCWPPGLQVPLLSGDGLHYIRTALGQGHCVLWPLTAPGWGSPTPPPTHIQTHTLFLDLCLPIPHRPSHQGEPVGPGNSVRVYPPGHLENTFGVTDEARWPNRTGGGWQGAGEMGW